MKIEIEVPDDVVEKIEHLMGLGIVGKMSLEKYLVLCVVEDTNSILTNINATLIPT